MSGSTDDARRAGPNHAVNPHTRNAQTENPEECEQHHVEPSLRHERTEVVAEGLFVDMGIRLAVRTRTRVVCANGERRC